MALIEGLDNLAAAKEEEKSRSPMGMVLLLRAGEAARVRFITDGPNIKTGFYHTFETGGRSRSGKPRISTIYCGWDDGESCDQCAKADRGSIRTRKMNLYLWVYSITHADKKVEEINAPRVLQTGIGKNGYITTRLTTFLRKYGTLCDRDYEWSRTGSGQEDTVYDLVPEDKGNAPAGIADVLGKLPPLEDVARGKPVNWLWSPAQSSSSETRAPQVAGAAPSGKSLLEKLREKSKKVTNIGEEL